MSFHGQGHAEIICPHTITGVVAIDGESTGACHDCRYALMEKGGGGGGDNFDDNHSGMVYNPIQDRYCFLPEDGGDVNKALCDQVLYDWFSNVHIPPIFIQDVLEVYERVGQDQDGPPDAPPPSGQPVHVGLLATSVYVTLKKEGIPRTLREISAMTGVSHKHLTSLLKKHFPRDRPVQPQDLVMRFVCQLGLTRREALHINNIIWSRAHSCNPATVVAGHIVQYLKQNNRTDITAKTVCTELGVSPVSVRRYLKRINI